MIERSNKKLIPLQQAVQLVPSGSIVTFSGFGPTLHPMAFTRELIRQGIRDIKLVSIGECWIAEMLAASRRLKEVNFSNFMFEGFGRCKAFSRAVETGDIRIEDYSHFSMANRFLAGALGLPFMPTRVLMGSDIANVVALNQTKYQYLKCPFSGDNLTLVPAIQPDYAIIHGARADCEGNVQIFGPTALIDEQARAAKKVIATVEEVVDTRIIRQSPEYTIIPSVIVDAIAEVPFGSHPTGMYKYYDYDHDHMSMYFEQSSTDTGVSQYLKEWVFDVKNHWEYLAKLGAQRLFSLRADPYLGYSLRRR